MRLAPRAQLIQHVEDHVVRGVVPHQAPGLSGAFETTSRIRVPNGSLANMCMAFCRITRRRPTRDRFPFYEWRRFELHCQDHFQPKAPGAPHRRPPELGEATGQVLQREIAIPCQSLAKPPNLFRGFHPNCSRPVVGQKMSRNLFFNTNPILSREKRELRE